MTTTVDREELVATIYGGPIPEYPPTVKDLCAVDAAYIAADAILAKYQVTTIREVRSCAGTTS